MWRHEGFVIVFGVFAITASCGAASSVRSDEPELVCKWSPPIDVRERCTSSMWGASFTSDTVELEDGTLQSTTTTCVCRPAELWPQVKQAQPNEPWTDPATRLTWQVNPSGDAMTWSEAQAYCADLGWRLPTVSELRSLIRGCPTTGNGGSCGVVDGCTGWDRCWDESCYGCDNQQGQGPAKGCYWPSELVGTCDWYWSSSPADDERIAMPAGGFLDSKWVVKFDLACVGSAFAKDRYLIRCVR
jgi:hypothetical protein